jgi:hypothetical protein
MSEVNQYSFELSELASLLVREQGLKQGKWVVGFEFNLGAGLAGVGAPDQIRPTAFASINKVVLTRHQEGTPEPPFTVDAAKLADEDH